jgi:branched-chain amino acid transport system ATP-binding protein
MLEIRGLVAGYGPTTVLHGVDLAVHPGEIMAVVGRNGAGKTTLVNAAMGLLPIRHGRVAIGDRDVTRLSSYRRSREGLAIVPQGRRVFGSLTVDETLQLASRGNAPGGRWVAEQLGRYFPELVERGKTYARNLSGGEQSMLAVSRAVATGPRFVMLDEPSEGLSPDPLKRLGLVLAQLRREGVGVLLVEQNLEFVRETANNVSIIRRGELVATVEAAQFREDIGVLTSHLAVA